MCEENVLIGPGNLPFTYHPNSSNQGKGLQIPVPPRDDQGSFKEVITRFKNVIEKRLIQDVMAETGGNKSETARRLKVDYKTLLRKLKLHEIARFSIP